LQSPEVFHHAMSPNMTLASAAPLLGSEEHCGCMDHAMAAGCVHSSRCFNRAAMSPCHPTSCLHHGGFQRHSPHIAPSPKSLTAAGLTPSTFPREDINATHTHASYSMHPITELANNDHSNWTLTLDVPIPEDIVHPTLTSLSYTVNYSTANDQAAAAVQTTVMLTSEDDTIPDGIAIDQPNSTVPFHHGAGATFAPQNLDGAAALCLLSVPATKPCEQPGQWNHYLDRQQISPSIRITTDSSCLKLHFHVAEYPTTKMIRSLLVNVSATWLEDLVGKRLLEKIQEAERKAEEARIAKEAAEEKAKSHEKARLAAEHMLQATAPPKADAMLQKSIAKALDELPSERRCTNGYVWNRTATGYKCDGGGHSITFEQLAAHT